MDHDLQLLLGYPVEIEGLGKIYPLKIKDIINMGSILNRYIHILTITAEDLDIDDEDEDNEITTADIVSIYSLRDLQFRKLTEEALSLFFKEEVIFSEELFGFIIGGDKKRFLYKDNYNEVKKIIQLQNGLEEDEEINTNSNLVKKMFKRIKKMRKKYNTGKGLSLFAIISSVCSKHSSINLLNVGELTMYQLIDQFKRLNMIEKYEIDIDALIHGAKKEDMKIKHWSEKIS